MIGTIKANPTAPTIKSAIRPFVQFIHRDIANYITDRMWNARS